MKKIYSKPETDVRVIEMAQMIAESGPQTSGTPADPEAGQDAKRRRGIFGSDDSDASNGIW